MASSDNGSQFAFGKVSDTDKQTEVDSTPTTDSPVEEGDKQSASVPDNDIDKTSRTESNPDEEYTDVRSVTIKLVKNQSLYRRVNDKVLPKRADYIGSSINSSRILSANKEEIETYFPNIVGVAPNNESFITRVKHYLNNIRVRVDELGKTFDTSFHYYKYSDYEQFKRKEEAIENRYAKADKSSLKKTNAALKERVTQLNALESSKCRYGYPINVSDYLMYRHCLLYKDIAKDMSIINSDPSIRFYFQDDAKEADKARKELLTKADTFDKYEGKLLTTSDGKVTVKDAYIAKNGEGMVFTVETKSFGGGLIEMIGVNKNGEITGVVIQDHKDTPGVGTKAFTAEHLKQYKGLKELKDISAKKDPSVNHITGASISSNAVHYGIYEALLQYKEIGGAK